MNYSTPLGETAIIALAEYTVGRVCEANSPATSPTDLDDIPPEAVQATLNQRVDDIDDIDQSHYDLLFDSVQGAASVRINA